MEAEVWWWWWVVVVVEEGEVEAEQAGMVVQMQGVKREA